MYGRRVDHAVSAPVRVRAVSEDVLDLEAIARVRQDVVDQHEVVGQLSHNELVHFGVVEHLVAQPVPDHAGRRVAACVPRPRNVDADAVEYQRTELHFRLSLRRRRVLTDGR